MSNIFVRSSDGNDADNGSTWALAKATTEGAAAIDAAGDTIFVSKNHSETKGSALTLALAGTKAAPTRILCVDDTGDPASPTVLATGAVVQCDFAGSCDFQITGNAYVYGVAFRSGLSFGTFVYLGQGSGGSKMVFEKCQFKQGSGNGAIFMAPAGNSEGDEYVWKNCDVSIAGTNAGIILGNCKFSWKGGSVLSTTTSSLVALFRLDSTTPVPGFATVDGVDFTNLPAAAALVISGWRSYSLIFRNCKLPASWTGGLVSGTLSVGSRVEMHNCDSSDTNYRLWIEDYAGSVKQETTLVKSGGASDGTTPLSWKMATNANANYGLTPLRTGEITKFCGSANLPVTVTVDVLHDSATALKDDEIWLEVQYLGTSGYPMAAFASDAKADALATGANQASSSATWTTTGMSNPNKQKLSVTFTPKKRGQVRAVVHLAKASYTVYVDPMLQFS